MEVMALIDELEDAIESGGKALLSGKRTIDTTLIGDILDRIRATVPQEIHTAHEIRARSEGIVTEAVVAARQIRATAEKERQASVQESSVTLGAEQHAKEIIAKAEEEAAKLRRQGDQAAAKRVQDADNYSETSLTKLGAQLSEIRPRMAALNATVAELEKAVDLGAMVLKSGRAYVGRNGSNGAKQSNGAASTEPGEPDDAEADGLAANGVAANGNGDPLDVDSMVTAASQKRSNRG
jgi:hypothetical protein